MKNLLYIILPFVFAGCFSSSAPETKSWMIESTSVIPARKTPPPEGASAFEATRMGNVKVSAPFDRASFVVRRKDGSVAFDAYNAFAAAPSALLRMPVLTHVENDGRFGRVLTQTSVAGADAAVEVLVRDLSLDCRKEGERKARAAVSIDIVQAGERGRKKVALAGDGEGEADAANGNYSEAFSSAVNAALEKAFRDLK